MVRSAVVGFRVDQRERALVQAAAAMAGVDPSTLLREIVMPVVGQRVAEGAASMRDERREEVSA